MADRGTAGADLTIGTRDTRDLLRRRRRGEDFLANLRQRWRVVRRHLRLGRRRVRRRRISRRASIPGRVTRILVSFNTLYVFVERS